MLIDNYNYSFFVATMTSNITSGGLSQGSPAGMMRIMSMGQGTPMPQPMWQAKMSHMVPGEWLGN